MSEQIKRNSVWKIIGYSIAVFFCVALIVAALIPQFVRARTSSGGGCINNLRTIDGAKQQWALEYHKDTNAVPTIADVAQYLKDCKFPVCYKGGKYTIGRVGEGSTCSIPDHKITPP